MKWLLLGVFLLVIAVIQFIPGESPLPSNDADTAITESLSDEDMPET
ncbi:hypothetical protein [Congregibacter sp.]